MSDFNSTLTHERLNHLLKYDPQTGLFAWRNRPCGHCQTKPVGYKHKSGYIVVMLDKVNYRAHRLAMLYVNKQWPDDMVDHINGIKHDNRFSNLRIVSRSGNGQNQRRARDGNQSGMLGAHKHGKSGWRSSIVINGEVTRLGTFRSPEEAHQAYLAAKREIHPMCSI